MVEDEPVIALDIQKALRDAGAMVVAAGMVESGLFATEHPELSGAVIDLRLGSDKGTTVCRRLKQLGVPFVVYTGYPPLLVRAEFPDVPVRKSFERRSFRLIPSSHRQRWRTLNFSAGSFHANLAPCLSAPRLSAPRRGAGHSTASALGTRRSIMGGAT